MKTQFTPGAVEGRQGEALTTCASRGRTFEIISVLALAGSSLIINFKAGRGGKPCIHREVPASVGLPGLRFTAVSMMLWVGSCPL